MVASSGMLHYFPPHSLLPSLEERERESIGMGKGIDIGKGMGMPHYPPPHPLPPSLQEEEKSAWALARALA